MVTVRQFSRGVGRTIRAMEREAQRAQRQRLIQEKALARQAMLDAAADAAEAYERLVELLTACHRVPFQRMDWASTAQAEAPHDPPYSDARERAAAEALAAYRPGWFARTFGLAEGQRAKLKIGVDRARAADAEAHRLACEDAAQQRDEILLAREIVARKSKAMLAAVNAHGKFDQAAIEGVNILAIEGRVVAVVDALELEDMPSHSVSLLQSGKMSRKPLAAGKRLELHRDNICSAAVRVAIEFLRILPIDAVEVLMQPDLLDRGSGHITPQPVLYARITAQALQSVNLQMAEAGPLAERLGAHFDWNRREGFRPLNLGAFDLPHELFSDEMESV